MLAVQLILPHVLLEQPCMEQLVNAVIHSLNQLHILVLLVEPFLEQHVLSPILPIGNVLVGMALQRLGVGVEQNPIGHAPLVVQSLLGPHAV